MNVFDTFTRFKKLTITDYYFRVADNFSRLARLSHFCPLC